MTAIPDRHDDVVRTFAGACRLEDIAGSRFASWRRVQRQPLLALPNPIDHQAFWRLPGDMGMTQQRLMERMGTSL